MRRNWGIGWALILALGLGMAAGVARAQDQQSQQDQQKQDKKSKKKAKKKDQSPTNQNEADSPDKERRAVREVVQDLQDAFEGHSPTRVTDALDENFYDYPRFEDQVTQFLEQNSEIRMYLRDSSTEVKGDKATLIVDGEMVFTPKAMPTKEITRRQQVEFFFNHTKKGWKIYDITPRNFFTF